MSENTNQSGAKAHIMYLHGLEGSPQGTKGRWMQTYFSAVAPEMPASRDNFEHSFAASYKVAKSAVQTHQPDVIVGSSFGGGILMKLLQSGDWSGNAVMLAPAGVMYGIGDNIPEGSHAIIIHSPADHLVSYADSELIVRNSGGRAELWAAESVHLDSCDPSSTDNACDGNHRLHAIIHDGMLARAVVAQLTRQRR